MSGGVLYNQALVTHNGLENVRLFNSPFAYIRPLLCRLRVLFLRVRRRPSRFPVICELLKEGCFDVGRLMIN